MKFYLFLDLVYFVQPVVKIGIFVINNMVSADHAVYECSQQIIYVKNWTDSSVLDGLCCNEVLIVTATEEVSMNDWT